MEGACLSDGANQINHQTAMCHKPTTGGSQVSSSKFLVLAICSSVSLSIYVQPESLLLCCVVIFQYSQCAINLIHSSSQYRLITDLLYHFFADTLVLLDNTLDLYNLITVINFHHIFQLILELCA